MSSERKKRVLFACVENSNRGQMAEAFAPMHGGDSVEAYSSGSKPSGRVNARAIEFMKERGYDLATHTSKSLDDIPQGEYDAAITMHCGDNCPMVRAKLREDWGIPDPKELPADKRPSSANPPGPLAHRPAVPADIFSLLGRLVDVQHEESDTRIPVFVVR
jgi:protein-tyrosine-phosphatase